jgi:hypothetical protein
MNEDRSEIFSQLAYDVDNRYVDLYLRKVFGGNAFVLEISDTSDIESQDTEIELYLTKENLKLVIDRLTKVLENEQSN